MSIVVTVAVYTPKEREPEPRHRRQCWVHPYDIKTVWDILYPSPVVSVVNQLPFRTLACHALGDS